MPRKVFSLEVAKGDIYLKHFLVHLSSMSGNDKEKGTASEEKAKKALIEAISSAKVMREVTTKVMKQEGQNGLSVAK